MIRKTLCCIICCLQMAYCPGQPINPDLLSKKWNAFWIGVPDAPITGYGVYHFRKQIHLASKPASFVIHVSADNRYKLFVNGTMVSHGPARGDLYHWNFETVDLAPFLSAGENLVTAVVWNFGDERPEAQVSLRTAFILQGNSASEQMLNTDSTWTCFKDERYSALTPDLIYTYYVSGPGERIDYTRLNEQDVPWKPAIQLSNGVPKGVFDWSYGWMLIPRSIPPMELKEERFASVRKAAGAVIPKQFLNVPTALTFPPHHKATIWLDQGYLTNAYPVLSFDKGKNASISLTYAEALYIKESSSDWKTHKQKGNRNVVDGKRFVGVKDQLIGNGTSQRFSPLWWRTYRYVQLEVETKEEPLVITDIYGMFTGYPFKLKSQFNTSKPVLDKINKTGWHTARLCANETYMDCPYYEQLQYFGDTRIQAMVSIYNSDDDRLVRQAIDQADYSRIAEGITLSRYPTAHPQHIPPFSLWWIGMLHDYWMHRPDQNYIKQKLPGMRQVLDFFMRYQQTDGTLKNVPYWNFTDWAEGKGWDRGVAPIGKDGSSAILDLQLCLAFSIAETLETNLGMSQYAALYKSKADQLKQTIKTRYWHADRAMFADTSDKNYFSQHTNTLAVLSGIITGDEAQYLINQTLTDTSLTQATVYFKYYLHQAVAQVGLGNKYMDLLADWHIQLDNGLTTWAEISDHNNARSDCHAWGASPSIEFFRIVLGIKTGGPGFKTILIEPHPGTLTQASGTMPHPEGAISVSYQLKKGKWNIEITLPPNTSGTFIWQGKSHPIKAGKNTFT